MARSGFFSRSSASCARSSATVDRVVAVGVRLPPRQHVVEQRASRRARAPAASAPRAPPCPSAAARCTSFHARAARIVSPSLPSTMRAKRFHGSTPSGPAGTRCSVRSIAAAASGHLLERRVERPSASSALLIVLVELDDALEPIGRRRRVAALLVERRQPMQQRHALRRRRRRLRVLLEDLDEPLLGRLAAALERRLEPAQRVAIARQLLQDLARTPTRRPRDRAAARRTARPACAGG